MAFHVRNRHTERLVRELARREKLGLTEAVHIAVSNELRRGGETKSLWDRTESLRKQIRTRIKDHRPVSKAFRDSLYE
jgi:antitoxin VapB